MQAQLDALALRIAENRVIAGLHYPEDNTAGAALGVALAGFLDDIVTAPATAPKTALRWLYDRALLEWKDEWN